MCVVCVCVCVLLGLIVASLYIVRCHPPIAYPSLLVVQTQNSSAGNPLEVQQSLSGRACTPFGSSLEYDPIVRLDLGGTHSYAYKDNK